MAPNKRWLIGSAVAAVGVYALLWIGYAQHWRSLTDLDNALLDGFYRYGDAHPGWVLGWHVFCTVLGPMAFRVVTLVVIVIALVRRNVRIAMFLLITVEISGLITEAAKRAADRPRPDTALVSAMSSSFPSGHALGVMVAVLALLTVALPVVRRPLRVWLVVLGVVIVTAIGLGRVVLNVHHPSDVLAGWVLGYAYFVVCYALVSPTQPITQPDDIPEARGTA